jgi:hypothetical protein
LTAAADAAVLAHGLGGSTDLPIPYGYAVIGAAWALTFTFVVIAFAWRRPRFDPHKPGHALPTALTRVVDSPITRATAALAALFFTVWIVLAGIFGPQSDRNALPGVFYVLLWVGIVAASLFAGPVWRAISPMHTVHWLLGGRSLPERFRYPERWGYWPAAAGLFAFVWLELASPAPGALGPIKLWLLCYGVLMLAGAFLCGPRWFARADPFEVYSVVVSRLSPFRRDPATHRIVVGNPLDHLPSLPVRPGIVAVLSILFGSTAFDSFSATPGWRAFADRLGIDATLARTAGLVIFISVVAVTFSTAARMAGGVDRQHRRGLPGEMAHSLVPIVVGYIFAHYLSYLVERGQQTVLLLLGLDDSGVHYVLSQHPSVLATIKVACVVAGHITAVIAAHDQALRLLPPGHQVTGQLAMMVTMVGYTFTGLYLLFGG